MKDAYIKCRMNDDIEFYIDENEFVTILGNSNDLLLNDLLNITHFDNIFVGDSELNDNNIETIRRRMSFALYKHLNVFVGETVEDEVVYGLESLSLSKDDIRNIMSSEVRNFGIDKIIDKDPYSLGISDKAKIKIMSAYIINPKIIVLNNILEELDYLDRKRVIKILKEFTSKGSIVINITNNIEEALFGNRIIIINDSKLVVDGKTLSVLNEEKLLKRLGLGLPQIIELNKYLIDYEMINKYYLDVNSLVGALWK